MAPPPESGLNLPLSIVKSRSAHIRPSQMLERSPAPSVLMLTTPAEQIEDINMSGTLERERMLRSERSVFASNPVLHGSYF
jgi:hypothetical protein